MHTIYSLLRNASSDESRPCLLASNGSTLSFEDLLHRISATSAYLSAVGIERTSVVGVSVPNGPDLAAAMISAACSAVCTPLPNDDPDAEIERNISALNSAAVLVPNRQSSQAARIAERMGLAVLELDDIWAQSAPRPSADSAVLGGNAFDAPSPNDTALILSTSGSTSEPKVVPLTHANLAHSIANTRDSLNFTCHDRSLNVLSLVHIHGFVGGLLSCLSAGGSVVCAPGFDPPSFFDWVEALAPTYLTAVPPMYRQIVALAADNPQRARSHDLRFVRSASAPLPTELADQVEQALGVPMVVSYGMTEAAPLISSTSPISGQRRRGSVGRPFGTEVRVVVQREREGDPFEEGEIEIRGEGVFSGYLDGAGQNAWADDGWFRTGDLGYFDSDGQLFVTGRLTEVINRGGAKISPARIDAAAQAHPGIARVASFPVNHATLGQDVVCAVTRGNNGTVSEQELMRFLRERLPSSHCPSRILFVEDIPVTTTGKLLRHKLSQTFAERLADVRQRRSRADAGPSGSVYESVARVWEEILEQPVSEQTDFLSAGGDSLSMIRCLAELNELFDTTIPIDTFLNNPELGDFVTGLERVLREGVGQDSTSHDLDETTTNDIGDRIENHN